VIDHVILISIDTLRADFLGSYGHPYIQTPVIDDLARRGVVFEKHMSPVPTTLASHTSMMTGLWPHTHGVPRNGFLVPEEHEMLAEILKGNGFRTVGFIGGYPLKKRYGFQQGFDHYDDRMDKRTPGIAVYGSQRSAENLMLALTDYLDASPVVNGERLFLFVHFFDVHSPYMPPEPYTSLYIEDPLEVRGTLEDIGRITAGIKKKNPEALARSTVLEALYAGEVSYVDHHLGRILETLAERGLMDKALVIITSDHGEAMAEHSPHEVWDHGYTVFDSTIRIPLIMRFPKDQYAGTRSDDLLSNVDIMPTVLDFLGIGVPEAVEGWSFAGLLTKEPYPPREEAYSEATKPSTSRYEKGTSWRNERKQRGVRTASHRLIHRPLANRTTLHELSPEYLEKKDRLRGQGSKADKALAASLMEKLERWHQQTVRVESKEDMSAESMEMLEALGYVDEEQEEN
jgi:arylsulfatase A-like enzyme